MSNTTERTSADQAKERFDTAEAAAKYAKSLGGTATHRREIKCILSSLSHLPRGATVLDLPCGTGRLLPELAARGFEVTEADSSSHMVELARQYAGQCGLQMPPERFAVANVLKTPFGDGQFDAVVCNRLFHHFSEPQVRRDALRELKRISRSTIVASFFCNLSFDGMVFHIKQSMKRKKADDRIPIPRACIPARH